MTTASPITDPSDGSLHLARGLLATLRRCRPPRQDSPHLDAVVIALIEALARGDCHDGFAAAPLDAVQRSGWLDGADAPLMRDGTRLAFRRWQQSLDQVVDALLLRGSAGSGSPVDPRLLKGLNQEQIAAVEAIGRHRMVLISGGPGTGKTSTVVRMLAHALCESGERRIGLAAPTGKAAARLKESVRAGLSQLPETLQAPLLDLPCATLHRWLQARTDGYRRNRHHPLPLDLLVVDELSMVDLALGTALLDALPPAAQLILVGDAAQLPPIGVGAIWAHLQQPAQRQRFGTAAVELHQVYRNRGALARLSTVLQQGGVEAFWSAADRCAVGADRFLTDPEHNLLVLQAGQRTIPPVVIETLQEHLQQLRRALTDLDRHGAAGDNIDPRLAAAALERLDNLQVLCPRRRGPWGVEAVHRALLPPGGVLQWPIGVPVLCAENQDELGLANGDRGLTVGMGTRRRLLFRCVDAEGEPQLRRLHPARLKRLEPALALTVHKAQGSEADRVLVLWPDRLEDDAALLYTAVTRARRHLLLLTARDPGNLGQRDAVLT